jgi:hypothetical protein
MVPAILRSTFYVPQPGDGEEITATQRDRTDAPPHRDSKAGAAKRRGDG